MNRFTPYQCNKCQAVFTTAQKFRLHISRVNSCDSSEPRHRGSNNKTCPKCNTTFSTSQGLRLHLVRLNPCDRQKPPCVKEETKESQTCPKCHAGFTTLHALLAHKKQVIPCSHETWIQTEYGEMELAQRLTDPKWAKSTQPFRCDQNKGFQLRKKDSVCEQIPFAHVRVHAPDRYAENVGSANVLSSFLGNKKRINDGDHHVDEQPKRARNQAESSVDIPTLEHRKNVTRNVQWKLSPAKYGDGVLTDGCCCLSCVQNWTRSMSARLQDLGDEVLCLRDLATKSVDDYERRTQQEHVDSVLAARYSSGNEAAVAIVSEANQPFSLESLFPSLSENFTRTSLIKRYNRLNDRIITNERALDDSVAFLETISGHDESETMELRRQIDELRVYVNVEKSNRDKAVAALVANRWGNSPLKFKALLENMTVVSRPTAEKMLHEECAIIANQVAEKEENLELYTTASSAEKDTSKTALLKSAKCLLEHERDGIFMRLLRSSRRVHFHVRDILSID